MPNCVCNCKACSFARQLASSDHYLPFISSHLRLVTIHLRLLTSALQCQQATPLQSMDGRRFSTRCLITCAISQT